MKHETFQLVLEFFGNDKKKAYNWFQTINSSLGCVRPVDMIKLGREKKLVDFIESSLAGNKP